MDAEVFSALARLWPAEMLTSEEVADQLRRLATLPLQRIPITGELLKPAWSLRDNIAARDALYVAAAEPLQARLLATTDPPVPSRT